VRIEGMAWMDCAGRVSPDVATSEAGSVYCVLANLTSTTNHSSRFSVHDCICLETSSLPAPSSRTLLPVLEATIFSIFFSFLLLSVSIVFDIVCRKGASKRM
jgi:hypothetical protein